MKNLKISQKLLMGIVGQLIFIALLVFFIFDTMPIEFNELGYQFIDIHARARGYGGER